ncbi:hypothetical protein [Amycolatopsis suaedae]|uniref:Uncharacterized protein n=1 Tax=Amycolatopsis suaedae TaxID=2510978 RepID=A0A4Q7JBA2_9PSEU|nr:hypothetical protein [Amycolatopsis suaedae]RZQ65091.1 hypothetical protein EWH70_04120 [Amycolatopsis suaedae]
MTDTLTRVRIPGRQRFAGVFTGDTPTLVALFVVGLLVSAFYKLAWWRGFLLGQSTPDSGGAAAMVALVLVFSALAARSMLRRGFLWAEAAELTWVHLDRVPRLGVRLWRLWFGWLVAVGYAGTLATAVYGLGAALWSAGAALLVAGFTLTLAATRRPGVFGEHAGPVVLAGAGLLVAVAGLSVFWLYVLAGVLAVAAVVLLWGSGGPLRPESAARADRAQLLENWRERVVRSVAVTFLDPMLLLPSGRPIGGRSLRKATVLRFAWLSVRSRARYATSAVLLAVLVVIGHRAFPAFPDTVLVAVGMFVALIPFAGGIGAVWRSPGLRRWIGGKDLTVRAWHSLVFAGVGAAWAVVLLGLSLLVAAPLSLAAWLTVPLAAMAIGRTATRKQMDYGNVAVSDTPMGQLPVGLATQAVRGPDLLLVGVVLLTAWPGPLLVPTLVVAVLTLWSALR